MQIAKNILTIASVLALGFTAGLLTNALTDHETASWIVTAVFLVAGAWSVRPAQ